MNVTATYADQIIQKQIKAFESAGNPDSAMELMAVLSITGPLRMKEFMDLPLTQKCEQWRDSNRWTEDAISRVCGEMVDLALGSDWRNDPAIVSAIRRKLPTDSL